MKTLQVNCELDYVAGGDADYVFNIQAANHPWQTIKSENIYVTPAAPFTFGLHPTGLNRLAKTRSGQGYFQVRYHAMVQVDYPLPTGFEAEMPIAALPVEVIPYIWSSRYCESDALLQVAARTFGELPRGFQRVVAICKWIRANIVYQVGSSGPEHCHPRGAGQSCRRVPGFRASGHHVLPCPQYSGTLCHRLHLVGRTASGFPCRLRGISRWPLDPVRSRQAAGR